VPSTECARRADSGFDPGARLHCDRGAKPDHLFDGFGCCGDARLARLGLGNHRNLHGPSDRTAALCALPVLLALWFAPALVVFQDLSAGRALATSLRASFVVLAVVAVVVAAAATRLRS